MAATSSSTSFNKLAHAIAENYCVGIEIILKSDPALCTRKYANGESLLHVVTRFPYTPTVEAIVTMMACGADIDALDEQGRTPLKQAADDRDVRRIQLLTSAITIASTGKGKEEAIKHLKEKRAGDFIIIASSNDKKNYLRSRSMTRLPLSDQTVRRQLVF